MCVCVCVEWRNRIGVSKNNKSERKKKKIKKTKKRTKGMCANIVDDDKDQGNPAASQ